MSEWRKRLRPGKFRDAEFQIGSHNAAGGRRVVVHEYPQRDEPYAEDLGRKAREFPVECFVLGDDYMAARDALLDALDKPGPGVLVHPYLGTRLVSVLDYRQGESSDAGGVADFSITFVEAGRQAQPGATLDSAAAVDVAATAASSAVVAEFAESFSVSGVSSFVSDAAIKIVQDMNSALRTTSGRIAAVTSPITEFSAQLDELGNNLGTLIRAPASLGADIAGVVFALAGVANDVSSALASYQDLGDFGTDAIAVPTTTATRVRQSDNQTALHALIRGTATIEAVRASARVDFASSADALAVRDALSDRIDTLMDTADDAAYNALVELRAAMVGDIAARGAVLPQLVRYTPPTTMPALLLAYRLHGDAPRDADIVSRNKIRHPGFVPGGAVLEVLTDGA